MDGGIFHEAHEVYGRKAETEPWVWLATFATLHTAEGWVSYAELQNMIDGPTIQFEVRPV